MSGEYISREVAIKEVYRFDGYLDDDLEWRLHYALKNLPAADVVEVVRCRDCVYWRGANDLCKGICIDFDADGYCSEGKRKDGGQEA